MHTKSRSHLVEVSRYKLRLIVAPLIPGTLYMFAAASYFLWTDLRPVYTRLYRSAPVVEVPFLAFGLLPILPLSIFLITVAVVSAWTGRTFDPARDSPLYIFQNFMLSISVKTFSYLVPIAIISSFIALLSGGYAICTELAISGAKRKLFWVNDERVCFKPDHYINDNWPCKIVNGKDVCIQVDGR